MLLGLGVIQVILSIQILYQFIYSAAQDGDASVFNTAGLLSGLFHLVVGNITILASLEMDRHWSCLLACIALNAVGCSLFAFACLSLDTIVYVQLNWVSDNSNPQCLPGCHTDNFFICLVEIIIDVILCSALCALSAFCASVFIVLIVVNRVINIHRSHQSKRTLKTNVFNNRYQKYFSLETYRTFKKTHVWYPNEA